MEEESPDFIDTFKLLAPYLALTVVTSLVAMMLFLRFAPGISAPPAVVSFDVIRYANAQRAVASAFLGKDKGQGVLEANETLHDLPKRAREAIRSIAGDGTLVVIKQAVVQGQTLDITEDVLKELGLPLAVPIADAPAWVMDELTPNALLGTLPVIQARPKPKNEATSNSELP